MTPLSLLVYLSDVVVIATYFVMSRHPQRALWFHIANALGSIPTVALEVMTHAWAVIPLTAAFGVIGAYGWATA